VLYYSQLAKKRPRKICRPVVQRTGEVGYWIISNQPVGLLTKSEIYWHLNVYPSEAEAGAAKAAGSAVVNSFGKARLLTIADAEFRPSGGELIAKIGPLPFSAGENYSVYGGGFYAWHGSTGAQARGTGGW
jgi:hypothetical protein